MLAMVPLAGSAPIPAVSQDRQEPGGGELSEGDASVQRVSFKGKRDRSSPNNRDIKLC